MVLEVNNKAELVVGLHSKLTEDELTGKIRLALGGMLVDKQKLFHPVRLNIFSNNILIEKWKKITLTDHSPFYYSV